MKKLFLFIFALLLTVSSAMAAVNVDFNIVDESGNAMNDYTLLSYMCTDVGCNTVNPATRTVYTEANMPLSLNGRYALYFYKPGYIPMERNFNIFGIGSTTVTYTLEQADQCRAPIQNFYVVNQHYVNEPLVINMQTEMDADVYSGQSLTQNAVGYIPQELIDAGYYSIDVETGVEVRDFSSDALVHEYSQIDSIFVGDKFDFNYQGWTPSNAGQYKILVTTHVSDDQCASTNDLSVGKGYSDAPLEVLPARPRDKVYALLNGLRMDDVEPVAGAQSLLKGNFVANYISNTLVKTPVETTLYLKVTGANGEVYTAEQNVKATSENGGEYIFFWTPAASQNYEIVVIANSTTEAFYQSKEFIAASDVLNTFALTTGTNTAPYWVRDLADVRVRLGEASGINVDLSSYVADAQGNPITLSLQESNDSVIDCGLTGTILTCGNGLLVGSSEVRIFASDGDKASSRAFTIYVHNDTVTPNNDTTSSTDDEDKDEWLAVQRFTLTNGDVVSPYDTVRLNIKLHNRGNDLSEVKAVASIPDLFARASVGPFDLDTDEEVSRNINLELDGNVEPGDYTIRLVVSDSAGHVYRVKHRTITIE